MNLKQQVEEKKFFLEKAYETAYAFSPSNPLSVNLNPMEFGKLIGFDEAQTTRVMMELVDDGYVQSSLGMQMLIVTRDGLDYLRQIEDEPLTAAMGLGNTQNITFEKANNSNRINMKQSEKLDAILRELYKHKNDGKYYSIGAICQSLNIPLDSSLELNKLAHRLQNDGYIKPMFQRNDCCAELTSHGIEYCEEDSYTYEGTSIISNSYNISLVNSPNSNIVNQSSNVTIAQEISSVNETIEAIKKIIATDNTVEQSKVNDILECLNEIQNSIINGQKPKFAIKSLIDVAGGISSIASLLALLAQYAGIIKLPI